MHPNRTSRILEDSYEIMYASEEEEFFYEDTKEPVQEGDPIGVEFTVVHSNEDIDWIYEQRRSDEEDYSMGLGPTERHQEEVWPVQEELEARYKDLLEDDSVLKEVKFVLNKGIYWEPDTMCDDEDLPIRSSSEPWDKALRKYETAERKVTDDYLF